MAKTAATASKKASTKTTGEDVTDIDSPPSKNKKQCTADRATSYFLMTTQKGYTVDPYSKGLKNRIDVVFHKGSVPPKSADPLMTLDLGGKALCVKWKASECLYSDKQATSQGIPKDSACYLGT
jgi:hypothetical protein